MKAQANSNFLSASEFNRFGLISLVILIIGCMGGITVGLGAINYISTLIMVVVPTMTCLSLLLSVAPMKWILITAMTCFIIDTILIIYFVAFT